MTQPKGAAVTGPQARARWERALRADRAIPWHVQAFCHFLASYMKPDGTGLDARVVDMMADSGLSKATVLRTIGEAEALGWLVNRRIGRRTYRFPALPADRSHERDLFEEHPAAEHVSPVRRVEPSIGLTDANQSDPPDRSHPRDLMSESHNAFKTPTQAAVSDGAAPAPNPSRPMTPQAPSSNEQPQPTADAPPPDSSSGRNPPPRARNKQGGRRAAALKPPVQPGFLLPFAGNPDPPPQKRARSAPARRKRRRTA